MLAFITIDVLDERLINGAFTSIKFTSYIEISSDSLDVLLG